MSNHYETLGVSKQATLDEIKKQYKMLAKKYHPDRNKEKNAIEKFKDISVAYDVLKDDTKRKEYDLTLQQEAFMKQRHRGGGSQHDIFGGFGQFGGSQHDIFGGIFDDIFNASRQTRREKTQEEKDIEAQVEERLRKMAGTSHGFDARMNLDPENLFREHEGVYREKQTQQQPRQEFVEVPTLTLEVTLDDLIYGTKRTIINKQTKKETVINIPAGTPPDKIIRMEKPRLDIHLKPKFRKWKFVNNDVYLNVPMTKFNNKDHIEIETILGDKIRLATPSNLKKGQKLRLKEKGWKMPDGTMTNLYIVIS